MPQVIKAAVNNSVINSSTEQNNTDMNIKKLHMVRFMHNSDNDTFTSTLQSTDLNQDNNNNNTKGASSQTHVNLHDTY